MDIIKVLPFTSIDVTCLTVHIHGVRKLVVRAGSNEPKNYSFIDLSISIFVLFLNFSLFSETKGK